MSEYYNEQLDYMLTNIAKSIWPDRDLSEPEEDDNDDDE